MLSFARGALTFVILLCLSALTYAQTIGGVNTAGTSGNEVIQGRIHFPSRHHSAMRPVIKLQSDSSSELSTVADPDGNFTFTHLRPDSYRVLVNGGDEFENAMETVSVGSAGPVPAQGNPSEYAIPVIYQVQIYLQPKKSAYVETGVQFLKEGKANKAAEVLAQAVKLNPGDYAAHLNYGIALLNLKKLDESEKQLRQALEINSDTGTGHYYLGLVFLNERQFEPAKSEFEVSIQKSHDQIALAHKYLGGIYWRNKQYTRAADELERYIALDPKTADGAKLRATIKDLRSKNQ